MGLFSRGDYSKGITETLKNNFNRDIESFQKSLDKTDNLGKEFERLGKIVNSVFMKSIGISYKFTYEDLKFEAKEKSLSQDVGAKVDSFCDMMNEMEFDKQKITKEGLLAASRSLSDLIGALSGTPTIVPEKPEIDFSKDSLAIQEEEKEIKKEELEIEKEEKIIEKDEERIEKILAGESKEEKPKKEGLFSRLFGRKKEEKIELPKNIPEPPPLPVEEDFSPKAVEEPKEQELLENKEIVEVQEPEDIKVPLEKSPEEKIKVKSTKRDKIEKEGFAIEAKREEKVKPIKVEPTLKRFSEEKIKIKPRKFDKIVKEKLPVKVMKEKIIKPVKVETKKLVKLPIKVKAVEAKKPFVKVEKIKVEKVEELPKFNISETLLKKEKLFEKNLSDIVKDLERGKRDIRVEVGLLDKEKKVLAKEKEKLKKVSTDTKILPSFKVFQSNISNEIGELETKRKDLLKKEQEINEKLKSISVMEKNLKQLSAKLKIDDTQVREKTGLLEAKETVLTSIKKELDKKYSHAIGEIEKLKNDLREKEENFLKLQKFYQSRENRLSVEEGNVIIEKKQYGKLVSNLLAKHLELASLDLRRVNENLETVKEKNKNSDKRLIEYDKKFWNIVREKDEIKKEMEAKKKYFDNLEEDFSKKDPEFEEINKKLDKRNETTIKRETNLIDFEKNIETTEQELRRKAQSFDIKELDLKSVEKDMDRIRYDMKSKQLRVNMMKNLLEKRMASYDMLRKDISYNIAREKRAITRIEKRLENKGVYIVGKLKETNLKEMAFDNYRKNMKGIVNGLGEDEELHIHDITITRGYPEVGNPAVLDILRLLNIGKDYMRNDEKERARDAYLEIQRIFEELGEEEREELFPEVLKVFKTKNKFGMPFESHERLMSNTNIDSLLQEFQFSVDSGNIKNSEHIYSRLQQKYVDLSPDEKERYYPRIMELYNRVLDLQVSTGVVI